MAFVHLGGEETQKGEGTCLGLLASKWETWDLEPGLFPKIPLLSTP